MAFQRMTDNVLNVSALPNVVSGQASALKSTFDKSGNDLKNFINNFLDSLESSTAAENIGADVQSVATKTLQAILTSFEEAIADRYTKTELDTLISTGTNDLVADLDVNLTTGVITVTKKDGTTETFDTALEKVPAKFEIVETDGNYALKVTNLDGTTTQTDVTNLMNIYSFNNSDTVNFEVIGEGNEKAVVANIKANSIGLDKLSLTVVSTIEGYMNSAKDSANAAKTSETNARASELNAAGYANTASNKSTEAATSANTAATKASEANKSAEEAKKWAEQAGGAAGDLSGYYTKTETDAKIEEAIEGIEIPEDEGNIPKFVGTEENPIDFGELYEKEFKNEDGSYYQGIKNGKCFLEGYVLGGAGAAPLREFVAAMIENYEIPISDTELIFNLYGGSYLVDYVYVGDADGMQIIFKFNINNNYFYFIAVPYVGITDGMEDDVELAINKENILFKDNTTEYTPKKDYHPATKKYVDDKKQTFTTTIPTTGWTATAPYYVDIAIEGMLNTDLPHITPVYTGVVATDKDIQEAWNKVDRAVANNGSLQVTSFEEVPVTEIPIQIEVAR